MKLNLVVAETLAFPSHNERKGLNFFILFFGGGGCPTEGVCRTPPSRSIDLLIKLPTLGTVGFSFSFFNIHIKDLMPYTHRLLYKKC